ncbi:YhfG family protein [Enterobacter sp. Bisph1]|uniref:YhfG family protein n=1 Tax=Enterobacter sp. Bisph1 TaxID=1274399 RepID=UPI000907AB33|nr:YhfG family protein [Enterobacter sp. Bisph1]
MKKKLTDRQKSRLWEQRRNANFQASRRLENVDSELITLSSEEAEERLAELRREYER